MSVLLQKAARLRGPRLSLRERPLDAAILPAPEL